MCKPYAINFILILLVALVAFNPAQAQTLDVQNTTHWAQPLHLKVGYAFNFGSKTDLNATGFSERYSNYSSPRVGFGYDINLNDKWVFSPSIQLGINNYKNETDFSSSGEGLRRTSSIVSSGDIDLEYIVSPLFDYAIYSDQYSRFSIAAGPQFTFNFIEILEGNKFSLGDLNGPVLSYEETTVNNTTVRVAGMLSLNYTTRFGKTPLRIEAFYAHSFGDQKSGTFQYDNFLNGESQTGDYSFKAHSLGLSLSIFAFGHGDNHQTTVAEEKETVKEAARQKLIYKKGYDPALQWGMKIGYSEGDIAAVDRDTGELSGLIDTNVYLGLYATQPINKKWAVRSELLYSAIDDNQVLQVPLQAQYTLIKNLGLFAGPNMNYIFLVGDDPDGVDRRWGVGMEVGLEYSFSRTFFAEARYNYGLTHQFSDVGLNYEDGRYSSLRFGIGIRF